MPETVGKIGTPSGLQVSFFDVLHTLYLFYVSGTVDKSVCMVDTCDEGSSYHLSHVICECL